MPETMVHPEVLDAIINYIGGERIQFSYDRSGRLSYITGKDDDSEITRIDFEYERDLVSYIAIECERVTVPDLPFIWDQGSVEMKFRWTADRNPDTIESSIRFNKRMVTGKDRYSTVRKYEYRSGKLTRILQDLMPELILYYDNQGRVIRRKQDSFITEYEYNENSLISSISHRYNNTFKGKFVREYTPEGTLARVFVYTGGEWFFREEHIMETPPEEINVTDPAVRFWYDEEKKLCMRLYIDPVFTNKSTDEITINSIFDMERFEYFSVDKDKEEISIVEKSDEQIYMDQKITLNSKGFPVLVTNEKSAVFHGCKNLTLVTPQMGVEDFTNVEHRNN